MRMTVQRKVILEQLRLHRDHPGAETIYAEVRKRLPRISLGTVYRNLDVLTASGDIQRLDTGKDHAQYDPNPENHPHFVCNQCGTVSDLRWAQARPGASELLNDADLTGTRVESLELIVRGLCRECVLD